MTDEDSMEASKESDFRADKSEKEEFLCQNKKLCLKEKQTAALTPDQKDGLETKSLLNATQLRTKQALKEEEKRAKKLEYSKKKWQQKREKYEFLRKEAAKLQSENRELSLKEKEVLKEAQQIEAARKKRLQASKEYRQKKMTPTTPEDIRKKEEAKKLLLSNNLMEKSIQEATELLNQNQDPQMSSEEKEIQKIALKIKISLEYHKQYRQRQREREELLRTEASKLVNLNRELSFEEKEVLRQANEMEEKRRKRNIATSRKFRKPAKRIEQEGFLSQNKELCLKEKQTERLVTKVNRIRKTRQTKREKDELLLIEAVKLHSENRELSLEEKEVLRLAKEIDVPLEKKKKKKTVNPNRKKRAAAFTPEQKEDLRTKRLLNAQKLRTKQASKEDDFKDKHAKKLEYLKKYRQKKRERCELIRKEAVKLQRENRELTLKEKEVLKEAQKIEAARKKMMQVLKEYRQKKIISTTPEDIRKKEEAKKLLLSNSLKVKSIQEATELLNQNQDLQMSSEEKEIQKIALKIKVARLRYTDNHNKRYAALTPEEKEAFKLKKCLLYRKRREALKQTEELKNDLKYHKQHRQRKRKREELLRTEGSKPVNLNTELSFKEKEVTTSRTFRKPAKRKEKIKESQVYGQESFQTEGCVIPKEQTASEFDVGVNELKIGNEELQETTINAIPARFQEDLNDSSWSSVEPSEKTCTTEERNQKYFRSFNGTSPGVSENYQTGTKIYRRKTEIQQSLSYMRSLIENMAKGDEFDVFGKLIGQKFRSNNTSVAEVNIAKLLIDNILQNLEIGFYNSENQIV